MGARGSAQLSDGSVRVFMSPTGLIKILSTPRLAVVTATTLPRPRLDQVVSHRHADPLRQRHVRPPEVPPRGRRRGKIVTHAGGFPFGDGPTIATCDSGA